MGWFYPLAMGVWTGSTFAVVLILLCHRMAVRRRMVGVTDRGPHCANCKYLLRGAGSWQCPECGVDARKGGVVTKGMPQPLSRRSRVAVVLLLYPVVSFVASFMLLRAVPTSWVVSYGERYQAQYTGLRVAVVTHGRQTWSGDIDPVEKVVCAWGYTEGLSSVCKFEGATLRTMGFGLDPTPQAVTRKAFVDAFSRTPDARVGIEADVNRVWEMIQFRLAGRLGERMPSGEPDGLAPQGSNTRDRDLSLTWGWVTIVTVLVMAGDIACVRWQWRVGAAREAVRDANERQLLATIEASINERLYESAKV